MRRASITSILAVSSLALASVASGCVGEDSKAPGANSDAGSSGSVGDGSQPNESGDSGADSGGSLEAGADSEAAPPPECDLSKPFAEPVEVPGVNAIGADDSHASLTNDELTIFFATDRAVGGEERIYSSTRPSRTVAFPTPVIVPAINSDSAFDRSPTISGDGTLIVFESQRTVTPDDGSIVHIFKFTRTSAAVNFSGETKLEGDNLEHPSLTRDSGAIYARSLNTGYIVRLQRDLTLPAGYKPAETLIGTGYSKYSPVSADDLTLYVQSAQPAADTNPTHIWFQTRASTTSPYGTPTELTSLNTGTALDQPSWLSPDGCRLYLTRKTAGAGQKAGVYVASRPK